MPPNIKNIYKCKLSGEISQEIMGLMALVFEISIKSINSNGLGEILIHE
jgi:hypothetical protein